MARKCTNRCLSPCRSSLFPPFARLSAVPQQEDQPLPGVERVAAVRMRKYARELAAYIAHNAASIVNYGERISTAFTASTINQVVSKRLVKQQQMLWTPEGAHLLLQVRTHVLNDDWEATFRSW